MPIKFRKGFSLVEIIVALLVTSLIGIAILSLSDSSRRDFTQVKETGKLQNESEILFATIENDLARGGFVHPIRGDVNNPANCKEDISAANAVKIDDDGDGIFNDVSGCYDKVSADGTVAYRYKVTYKLGAGGDPNTLYKKVERTDNCINIIGSSSDPDFATTIHGWQPVSDNISTINFSYPTIDGVLKNDLLDVNISFVSSADSNSKLPFRKNVFLRNKNLGSNSTNCDNKCPNSKLVFKDYVISENPSFWNPNTRQVPSARVLISNRFANVDTNGNFRPAPYNNEDKLEWDADLAADIGLMVSYENDRGLLVINGTADAIDYQRFIRTVRYVNSINNVSARTTYSDAIKDRKIVLSVGFPGICNDLIGRVSGTNRHFYCYVKMSGSVNDLDGVQKQGTSYTWPAGRKQGWPYWTQARLRAESTNYYNLKGYLATVTSEEEQLFIRNKIEDPVTGNMPPIWLGGSDLDREGEWKWVSGPESIELGVDDVRMNWRENCVTSGGILSFGRDGDPDTSNYCYPGYGGIGIGVFYRDEGGKYCRTKITICSTNWPEMPNIHNAYNKWGGGEPNDCCQNRNYNDSVFSERSMGEIIPDGYANRFIGQYSTLEANSYLSGGTKRNGLPLMVGNLYYNSTDSELKVWNGSNWVDANSTHWSYNSTGPRFYNMDYYSSSERPPNKRSSGEHYLQFRSDGWWNDLYVEGHKSGSLETKGYLNEFSSNWKAQELCSNASEDNRYACVNYFAEFNITLDDFTYQDEEMLDFCDLTPLANGDGT